MREIDKTRETKKQRLNETFPSTNELKRQAQEKIWQKTSDALNQLAGSDSQVRKNLPLLEKHGKFLNDHDCLKIKNIDYNVHIIQLVALVDPTHEWIEQWKQCTKFEAQDQKDRPWSYAVEKGFFDLNMKLALGHIDGIKEDFPRSKLLKMQELVKEKIQQEGEESYEVESNTIQQGLDLHDDKNLEIGVFTLYDDLVKLQDDLAVEIGQKELGKLIDPVTPDSDEEKILHQAQQQFTMLDNHFCVTGNLDVDIRCALARVYLYPEIKEGKDDREPINIKGWEPNGQWSNMIEYKYTESTYNDFIDQAKEDRKNIQQFKQDFEKQLQTFSSAEGVFSKQLQSLQDKTTSLDQSEKDILKNMVDISKKTYEHLDSFSKVEIGIIRIKDILSEFTETLKKTKEFYDKNQNRLPQEYRQSLEATSLEKRYIAIFVQLRPQHVEDMQKQREGFMQSVETLNQALSRSDDLSKQLHIYTPEDTTLETKRKTKEVKLSLDNRSYKTHVPDMSEEAKNISSSALPHVNDIKVLLSESSKEMDSLFTTAGHNAADDLIKYNANNDYKKIAKCLEILNAVTKELKDNELTSHYGKLMRKVEKQMIQADSKVSHDAYQSPDTKIQTLQPDEIAESSTSKGDISQSAKHIQDSFNALGPKDQQLLVKSLKDVSTDPTVQDFLNGLENRACLLENSNTDQESAKILQMTLEVWKNAQGKASRDTEMQKLFEQIKEKCLILDLVQQAQRACDTLDTTQFSQAMLEEYSEGDTKGFLQDLPELAYLRDDKASTFWSSIKEKAFRNPELQKVLQELSDLYTPMEE